MINCMQKVNSLSSACSSVFYILLTTESVGHVALQPIVQCSIYCSLLSL